MKIADAGAKAEAGKVRLTLTVEQSAPAYALRLPLEIVFPGRSETRSIDVGRQRDVVTMHVDADARRRAPGPGAARLARAGPRAAAADPAPVDHRAGAAVGAGLGCRRRARGRRGIGEALVRGPAASRVARTR